MLTDVYDLRSVEECTSDAEIMTVKVCQPVRSFVQSLWRDVTKVTAFVGHNESVFTQVVLQAETKEN